MSVVLKIGTAGRRMTPAGKSLLIRGLSCLRRSTRRWSGSCEPIGLRRLTEAGYELGEVAILRHDDRAFLTGRAEDRFVFGVAVSEIADGYCFDLEAIRESRD